MTKPNVIHENQPTNGRYVIEMADGSQAEMTYRRTDANTIAIDHTFVPASARGQGIAQHLMDYAIAQARENKHRIVPVCSYVSTQFQRHPEWAEFLASS